MASIFDIVQQQYQKATEANRARLEQTKGIYDEIIGRYRPGGGFGAGYEAQLGRAKTQDVAAGTQSLVGAGLYGTTQTAGLGKKWEEEVGAPARLRLEDLRMGRLSEAQRGKAGLIERVEDQYPDLGLLSSLMQQASSAPRGRTTTRTERTYGPPTGLFSRTPRYDTGGARVYGPSTGLFS